ncbi:HalOD1 output domain-containing protein [Halostella sp. PRR32]|nr:HalOD1 output domain-containing protein [Halostella sp. PRR32]
MTVAEALDVDPLDLSPSLNEILDPDALNSLFDSMDGDSMSSLTFSEWDCTVTVYSDGRILVEHDE